MVKELCKVNCDQEVWCVDFFGVYVLLCDFELFKVVVVMNDGQFDVAEVMLQVWLECLFDDLVVYWLLGEIVWWCGDLIVVLMLVECVVDIVFGYDFVCDFFIWLLLQINSLFEVLVYVDVFV